MRRYRFVYHRSRQWLPSHVPENGIENIYPEAELLTAICSSNAVMYHYTVIFERQELNGFPP